MFKNLEKNELTSVNYTSVKKQIVRDIPFHFRSSILIKVRELITSCKYKYGNWCRSIHEWYIILEVVKEVKDIFR